MHFSTADPANFLDWLDLKAATRVARTGLEEDYVMPELDRSEDIRRGVDFGLALLGGILTFPVMLATAAAIVLFQGRPVFFTQTRAGRYCKPFKILKFCSMPEIRDGDGNLLGDEDRTTRFGRLLRRTRLDELPEFWNVLKGDMAIVGPRPLLPETIRDMDASGAIRCSVRPGLTGWAQISGGIKLNNNDKLALDLWYIEHRSFLLDLKIIASTPAFLVLGDRHNKDRLRAARICRNLASNDNLKLPGGRQTLSARRK